MPSHLEQKAVALFVGILLGILLGITIKYPVKMETIKKYEPLCAPASTLKQIKVNVTGNIYSIECDNGVILRVY
jgi:hypothetical protein